MSRFLGFKHKLWSLLHRRSADAETQEELAFHLARQTAKHLRAGLAPEEARRRAMLDLGGVDRWRERTAEVRSGSLLEDLARDTAYAVRGLATRRGFALSALATLAIGIGASTTIFGVIDGALLRPLPFPGADRAMSLMLRMPIPGTGRVMDMVWSYPKYELLHDRQRSFSALALHSPETLTVLGSDGAERVSGEMAGAAYFGVLGVRPEVGRLYTPDEDRIGGRNDVVVLSDDFWHTRLGATRDVLGQTLTIDGVAHAIVGVLPPGFHGLSGDAQLWIPVPSARSPAILSRANAHNMELVGRLAPGVSAAQARAEIDALGRGIDQVYPEDEGHWGATAYTLAELRVNPVVRRSLELLALATVLMLAIVCVNLSTLLLTRGAARQQELAVRLAVGGSRGRIVRQLVTESLALAALGGAAGLAFAIVATRGLAAMLPLSMPTTGLGTDLTRLVFVRVHLDARGVGFAAVLTVAVGLGVGLVSAIRVAGPQILGALRQGAASAGRRRTAARTGLVTAQVALALVFLVASGLTLQSFRRTLDIPLGYRPDGLLAVKLTLDPIRVATQPTGVLWREVLDAVGDVPGVRSVALGDCSPLGMHCDGTTITPAGHVGAVHVLYLSASQGYFETLGTPLLRGRAFREGDDTSAVGAVIINQAAARAGWGDDDPLEVPVEGDARMRRVVGIVDDARYGDVELPPQPMVFVPFAHRARGVVFVRTDRESATLIAPIRQAIRRAGRGHAPGAVQTMTSRLRDATIRNRLSAQVFTGFAIAALLLAALGVYGTAALSVLQRAREFAIRRALGASTASLVGAVARQITWVVLAGGVAGIVGAIFVNQALTAILFDVRSVEPRILGASATLLLAAILAACVGPAARSLRIDPRDAMRAE